MATIDNYSQGLSGIPFGYVVVTPSDTQPIAENCIGLRFGSAPSAAVRIKFKHDPSTWVNFVGIAAGDLIPGMATHISRSGNPTDILAAVINS